MVKRHILMISLVALGIGTQMHAGPWAWFKGLFTPTPTDRASILWNQYQEAVDTQWKDLNAMDKKSLEYGKKAIELLEVHAKRVVEYSSKNLKHQTDYVKVMPKPAPQVVEVPADVFVVE